MTPLCFDWSAEPSGAAGASMSAKQSFDLTEMVVAVERAIESEVGAARLDLLDEVGGDGLQRRIHDLGGRQAELDRRSRGHDATQGLEGIVHGVGVDWGKVDTLLFPSAEEDENPLVPESEVGQERSNCPPVRRRSGEVLIGQAADQGFESPLGFGILFNKRECHAPLLCQRVSGWEAMNAPPVSPFYLVLPRTIGFLTGILLCHYNSNRLGSDFVSVGPRERSG